jgi:hypothetical protein
MQVFFSVNEIKLFSKILFDPPLEESFIPSEQS